MLYADHPEAEHWVYGGAVRYPDPGDVVKVFPRSETLTLSLEVSEEIEGPYSLHADGCRADYTLVSTATGAY